MNKHMIVRATPYSFYNVESTIVDWLVVSKSGFRSSEWYQHYSNKLLPINGSSTRNIDSSAAAFIARDFTLCDQCKYPILYSSTLSTNSIASCNIFWEYQISNDNGEIITNDHNDLKYTCYYIRIVQRILTKADSMGINVDTLIIVAMVVTKKRQNLLTCITSLYTTIM